MSVGVLLAQPSWRHEREAWNVSCSEVMPQHVQAAEGKAPVIDPAAAKKAAEEAEERRLTELRALGTPVNPDTFNAWKAQFYAESALARTRS